MNSCDKHCQAMALTTGLIVVFFFVTHLKLTTRLNANSSPRAACSSDFANQPLFLHRYSFHRLPMAIPMPDRRILQRPDGAFIERHAWGV